MLHDPELHYLDNAATTIVAPEVADVIDKAMREHWANPSSLYAPGARSEEVLNAARAAVARTLGCKSKELYFTSCGSEGNNLALLGAAQTRTFGKGIVMSGFEHPSVQRPLERLAAQGYNVTVVKPQADGTLDINKMLDAVDKNTILVACMMVNNEIGTRNDVERLAAEVKRRNSRTIVHVDAVQAWMRVPIKLDNIDTMAVSGHKIHGPKGVGFLYIDEKAKVRPILFGGGQQKGMRSGTENVPGCAGLGAAVREVYRDHEAKIEKLYQIRERLIAGLKEAAHHDRKILVEETIVGREIECAVFGNGTEPVIASGVGEILAAADFYDFDAKYYNAESRTVVNPELPGDATERVRQAARRIFKAVDGYGLSRVDFFVTKDGEVIFNEINTMPGFTAISMYPMLFEAAGIPKPEMVTKLIEHGLKRYEA